MSPIDVVIWSCVAIFIITSVLTLLHVSGIRELPDPNQGKILFKALVVEIVVIAVAAFGSTLIPKNFKPMGDGMAGPISAKQGMKIDAAVSVSNKTLSISDIQNLSSPEIVEPATQKTGFNSEIFNQKTGRNCYEITVSDSSKYPKTSRIETICETK